jgi:hypothetical protein
LLERAPRLPSTVRCGIVLGLVAASCGCATSTPADASGTPCTRDGDCASGLACIAGICGPVEAGAPDGDSTPDADALPD